MKTHFLGQGYNTSTDNAVGTLLTQYLAENHFKRFTCMSAFASEAALLGLASSIKVAKSNFEELNIIVGVDQGGTSKNALLSLSKLEVNSYVFYQKEAPIFHPKIYLFEGEENRLIIGSSNLTAQGLFGNIESSLLVEFSSTDEEGLALLSELKTYYHALFSFNDPNLFPLSSSLINNLVEVGVVPKKASFAPKTNRKEQKKSASILDIPKRAIARIPSFFWKRSKSVTNKLKEELGGSRFFVSDEPLWKSNPLTERDLNIPKGNNTNPTGSMLFKKGQMENIDQRSFFRTEIFNSLPWLVDNRPAYKHYERTEARFRLIVLGSDKGVFRLRLSHNTNTSSKTYLQNNSMTSISWGDAKSVIADKQLIGKIASLHLSSDENCDFILSIN